jgi:hypothetical protein
MLLCPTPHNRSQHIQDNTTRGFIQSVLLTMGIMMPETCWVNLSWINVYTCVICWFFLLLASSCLFVYRPHGTTRFPLDGLLMEFDIWRFFENLFRIFSSEYDSVDTCTWKNKRPLGTARGSQWRAQWTSVGGTVIRPSLVESNRIESGLTRYSAAVRQLQAIWFEVTRVKQAARPWQCATVSSSIILDVT